jgi:hypothetical protein
MMRAASITLLLSTVLGILSTACGQDNETAEAPDCCYVVAEKETCADLTSGYEQVGTVGSTIKLNGINAIQCCEDPSAVMNMDGEWCTGSAGQSEEATVPSNTFTEVSSNSSVVESHTEEHSESQRRRAILKQVPPQQRQRLMVLHHPLHATWPLGYVSARVLVLQKRQIGEALFSRIVPVLQVRMGVK